MRVGGRRQLIIPPDMAYGTRGAGNVIAPGETLVRAGGRIPALSRRSLHLTGAMIPVDGGAIRSI